MAYDALMTAIQDLPEDKVYDVVAFVDFLKYKLKMDEKIETRLQDGVTRQFGLMKGKIKMSEDFDEIPAGFEEYM